MLNKILKIILAILCSYIILAKIYVTMYYTSSDIVEHLTNFIVCCSCIGLYFIIFNRIKRIGILLSLVLLLILLFAIFTQTITEGLNALTKSKYAIYPNTYLWIYDIPNLLSILVMIFLLILILIKNRKEMQ